MKAIKVTRRQFMQTNAAVTLGLASATHRVGPLNQIPPRKIKIGFLGTGYSHFSDKHKLVSESSDWQLIGLCEEDDPVRAKGPGGARWLSAEQLFAEAELVVVESAIKDHARDAKRALLAGRHVHLEKPPADTMEGLRELLRLAADKQRLLQIGYMWRYNPGINAVLEAARKGWLGDVYLVRATMNTRVSAEARREWARFRGGAMFEQGCHLIDPLVRLLGQPLKVSPHLKHSANTTDQLADNTVAVFEFERALGIITSAPLQPNAGPQRFFEVLGTNGTARVQPLEQPALTLELAQAAGPYVAGKQEVKLLPYRRYVDEFAVLANALREGKSLPFTAAEELNVQKALLQACEML